MKEALVTMWVSVSGGCAMQQKKVLAELQHPGPVDCSTAQGDLRLLQSETVEGASAIYPAGAIVGIPAGTEGTKLKVALGEYDEAIDARIAQIKETCGIG